VKLGAWVADQWPYLLGASALGGIVLIAISTAPKVGPASLFVPPDAKALRVTWVQIDGSPVALVRGRRYRGCVQVPFVVPTGMVVDRLPAALAEKGFTDARISRGRPGDWPDVSCDIFVEATWGKPDEQLARPGAVSLAWRGDPVV
jgi:hypothetical protein